MDSSLDIMVNISRLGKFGRKYLIFNGICEYCLGKYYLFERRRLESDQKHGVVGSTIPLSLSVLSFNNYYYAYISP